ncbi:extended synaptotagmin-2-A isoform X1 [Pimephales promelas]|uniref:extended synaptotagmin-2-A isoform X1 n=1 Tax=Pimephales promelas TaxID=90988 RepID=UPI001955D206|nr:extended synaptotagmin-2-A isoform X1 [Pimephales promelas]KAG1939538.1 extended synaptotagmin-2 [Pimephales promelas]
MSASANGVEPKPAPAVSQNGPGSAPTPKDVETLKPVEPDEEPQSSMTDATQMGIKFAKTFLVIFPIYVLGYLEFSFSWVLIGLAVLFWIRRNQGTRFARVNQALAFLEHEERAVRQTVRSTELPPWVHFPDVERVEWLNKTVHQMWPYICQFVDKIFRETIEPAVQGANAHLSTFTFSKIDMGDKPLRVDGVKVYTENVDKRQIIMDLQISFVGNTEIDVDIKKYYCRAGIKSIQLNGVLRVVMDPLLGDMPLIGALSVFFLQKPFLDINWTGLTNMLDIPGINGLCDSVIQDIIYSFLVLPNKITIPLVSDAQISKLRFPMPKGVLRIHFLEAQDLVGKDTFLGGMIKGKSDPYGVLQLGNQLFRSKVIKESVNPKWNEVYEACVYDHSGQNLEIELYDEDTDKDDFLGSLTLNIDELQKEQKIDEWFSLDDIAKGKLHLKIEWLSLLSTPDKLDEVLSSVKAYKGQANDGLSSAVLLVLLDSGKNLPRNPLEFNNAGLKKGTVNKAKKSGKKVSSVPSPFVQFTVGHKSFESKTRYKTNEPVWEEAFTFLIHNPKCQELEVEVKDDKHECSLGTCSLPLSKLLQEDQMTISQRFLLKNSGPGATLKMKIALRIISVDKLAASDQPSSVQIRRPSSSMTPSPSPHRPNVSEPAPASKAQQPNPTSKTQPTPTLSPRVDSQMDIRPLEDSSSRLVKSGRSASNLAISGSLLNLNQKEPTPSIASDISNPSTTQELQRTMQQLQNGASPGFAPLGEIQLTIRHSPQRNKLIVVVHSCRNLISSSESGSDPYVRLYLLPDKRRSGRRKTNTIKKTVNPVYDQTYEFSVSLVELHRRVLDVAVKNGGGILSKHRGLLGKVLVDLTSEDISKSSTQWYELTVDGQRRTSP